MGRMDDELRKKIETYMYRGDLDEALTVLAKSEVVVASRFHASILGLLFGKKVLPMAYSDKTTNILNDMNFEGPVIDIRKIDEFDGSTFDFSSLKINDVSAQKTLAEKQFQELDKVLTRRK
jgi:colanic acid/amylovoran biosynthesis protein